MAEWKSPTGGMFLWVKLPDVEDTKTFCEELIRNHHIIIVAGAAFLTSDDFVSQCVRISFTLVTDEQMEKVNW